MSYTVQIREDNPHYPFAVIRSDGVVVGECDCKEGADHIAEVFTEMQKPE